MTTERLEKKCQGVIYDFRQGDLKKAYKRTLTPRHRRLYLIIDKVEKLQTDWSFSLFRNYNMLLKISLYYF